MVPPKQVGRYRLIRRIGRGGMGEVYLAQYDAPGDIRLLVAVKMLLDTGDGKRGHDALMAEARLTAMLSHPNIVQVLDAGLQDGVPWFAMELVRGLALSDLFEAGRGRIPPWVAARIVADACAAVHALHQARDEKGRPLDAVHRDVTPHNLLISWDGIVKLADLGLARSALQRSATRSGVVKGKLGYMSPEQASGAVVDRRTDLFALGVILWEALAGRRLFQGTSHSETLAAVVRCQVPSLETIAPGVPATLAEIAMRALERDPAQRFASALEMQRQLEAALGASGLVVGAAEVGQTLAALVPERASDPDRWSPEPAPPATATTEVLDAGHSLAASEGRSTAARAKGTRLPRFIVAAAALGAVAVATTVTVIRAGSAPASGRPTEDRGQPTAAATSGPARPPAPATAAAVAPAPAPVTTAAPAPVTTAPSTTAAAARHAGTRGRPAPDAGSGDINISANPTWATIRLDGKTIGTTPTVITGLRRGKHVVEALWEGKGPAQRRTVIVQPAATTKVEFSRGESAAHER